MTKYYIGQIHEINGEYSYETTLRFVTSDKPEAILDKIASTWYSNDGEKQDSGYYEFNCGCVAVRGGNYQEVSKEVYDSLTLLTEM